MFEVCPLCEKGVLVETQEDGLLFSVCTACESEITNAEQMKKNKEAGKYLSLLQQKDIGAEYEQALLKNLDDLYEE